MEERTGAIGPITNYAFGYQNTRLFSRLRDYSPDELARIEEFAAWLKEVMGETRVPTDNVVGFCFASPRQVLEEVGHYDEQFQYGMFEDVDLMKRIKNMGLELAIDFSTFIQHGGVKGGSVSILQEPMNANMAFSKNIVKFAMKWNDPIGTVLNVARWNMNFFNYGTISKVIKETAKEKNLWQEYEEKFQ